MPHSSGIIHPGVAAHLMKAAWRPLGIARDRKWRMLLCPSARLLAQVSAMSIIRGRAGGMKIATADRAAATKGRPILHQQWSGDDLPRQHKRPRGRLCSVHAAGVHHSEHVCTIDKLRSTNKLKFTSPGPSGTRCKAPDASRPRECHSPTTAAGCQPPIPPMVSVLTPAHR